MAARPAHALRARIALAFLLLSLTLFAQPSRAIQLRWSSGGTDTSFTTSVRAALVVLADSAEVALPSEWRLMWTADSLGVGFASVAEQLACQTDTAQVQGIDAPSSPADSAARQITAHFCSAGASTAVCAVFLVDLPAGGHGKMKVIALDPSDPDSSSVLVSPEVTFNGGVDGEYAPTILYASHLHTSALLRVHAVGAGLATATQPRLMDPTDRTSTPLTIVDQNDSSLTAEAQLPSALPGSELHFGGTIGVAAPTTVEGDVVLGSPPSGVSSVYYVDPDPQYYPKDFAFVYNTVPTATRNVWRGLFHLFYIRHHVTPYPDADNEVTLGHAWTSDLSTSASWHYDLDAFPKSGTGWDASHVWAPTIVQWGGKFRMFYTGVDGAGNQSIGYASTSLLDTTNTDSTWERHSSSVLSVGPFEWIEQSHPYQLRDPFVMADPDSVGRLLMFFVAANNHDSGKDAVGVTRNDPGTLDGWSSTMGYYRSTDTGHAGSVLNDESPHVFPDPAYPSSESSAQATWRLMFTDGPKGPDSSIRVVKKLTGSLADTTLAHWQIPASNLMTYLNGDSTVWSWRGTEYLRLGSKWDFMGAYDGNGIAITRMYWSGTDFVLAFPSLLAVPNRLGAARVRLTLTELRPGSGGAKFALELPSTAGVKMVVYDVMGRRVRTLVDRVLPAGVTRIAWDGRGAGGGPVWSGIYFARLTCPAGNCVVRLPIIR